MDGEVFTAIARMATYYILLGIFIGITLESICYALDLDVPEKALKNARKESRRAILTAFFCGSLPIFIFLSGTLVYIYEKLIGNINGYRFGVENIDFIVTFFQIHGVLVALFTCMSFVNVVRMVKKWLVLL